MAEDITFIGLDVHKATIAPAVAESVRRGEVRALGTMANEPEAVARLIKKLSCHGRSLRFCDESGPSGYGLYRQPVGAGHQCAVVAPALIPRRAGD